MASEFASSRRINKKTTLATATSASTERDIYQSDSEIPTLSLF